MPDEEPANDNDIDDDEAHYLGLIDTLPMIPLADRTRSSAATTLGSETEI